jgi:hypothetical protein
MLSSPDVRDLLAPLREEFEAGLDEMREAGDADANEALDLALASRGRITVAIDFDLDVADDRDGPQYRALFALTPGPDEDGERLAELLRRLAEQAVIEEGRSITEQAFGERLLQVAEPMPGEGDAAPFASLPQWIDGSVLMFVWTGEPEGIEAWGALPEAARFEASTRLDGALAARISAGTRIRELLDQIDEEEQPFLDPRAILDGLGLLAFRSAELQLAADGEFVAFDFDLRWEGASPLFEIMVPEAPGRLQLLDLVPRTAPVWGVSTFRAGRLFDLLAGLWDEFAPMLPIGREDAESMFADEFKVRLREDLVDHLGDEMMTVSDQNTIEDEDVDDPLFMFSAQSYAFELRDAKAFAASFETLLRARGLHAARKTTDYRGFAVQRLRLGGIVVLDYAITDRLFIMALNSKDPSHLRAILDEEALRAAGEPVLEMPAEIRARVPAGLGELASISVLDATFLTEIFRTGMLAAAAEEGLDPLPPEFAEILEVVDRLEAAVRDAKLARLVSLGWAEPGRLRARLVW